jgi:hypothetical protein
MGADEVCDKGEVQPMNAVDSEPLPPASLELHYPEKVRVIRQSIRCLVFGFIGVIPFLGLPLALQTLQLRRAIGRTTGDESSLRRVFAMAVACFLWLPLYLVVWDLTGLGMVLCVFAAGAAVLFKGVAGSAASTRWNPARGTLYFGVWLSCIGLFATAGLILRILILRFEPWMLGIAP